ncbi:hypothetical protein L1049_027848 [Liquidambar formosana]|uniref:Inositol polyphosphate-related phosphatase domain-containing protein n=1 Tax=Liquidambar formosana TaxID=63359 RepID=A0AAP0RJB6_LIQFO
MQGKQEVIWPRLVASKILRGRLGSNNFIADSLDSTETLLERPNENQASDLSSKRHSTDQDTHKFQEIVPLNAGNILGSKNNEVSMKWNSLIREALNKTIPISKKIQDAKVGELQKVYPLKDRSSIKNSYFRCIISKQMVGIFMSVWVRSDLCHYIRHPSVSCVGCGIMGCLGNKGSVSVRFYLHETSFCFVCCHLASGGKEGNERRRNADAAEILTRTSFPRGPSRDLPHKILDHEYDLNEEL